MNFSMFTQDRQVVDIFTKTLGLDKLQYFSQMLGIQPLDMPHLRERMDTGNGTGKEAGEEERTKIGGDEKKEEAKLTKEVGTSEQVGASGNNRVKKDMVDRKKC